VGIDKSKFISKSELAIPFSLAFEYVEFVKKKPERVAVFVKIAAIEDQEDMGCYDDPAYEPLIKKEASFRREFRKIKQLDFQYIGRFPVVSRFLVYCIKQKDKSFSKAHALDYFKDNDLVKLGE